MPAVSYGQLATIGMGEPSHAIRERVKSARRIQRDRFKHSRKVYYNSTMTSKQLQKYCEIDEDAHRLLKQAINELHFSARVYDRLQRVARTIADLQGSEKIRHEHIAEAIQYRSLDRQIWV